MMFTDEEIRFIKHELGLTMDFDDPNDGDIIDLMEALDETPNETISEKVQSYWANHL